MRIDEDFFRVGTHRMSTTINLYQLAESSKSICFLMFSSLLFPTLVVVVVVAVVTLPSSHCSRHF